MRLDELASAATHPPGASGAHASPCDTGGLRLVRLGTRGRVCDFAEDSRTVLPGSLFVARKGRTSDGRRFIQAAAREGAVAVLTDKAGAEHVPDDMGLLVADDVPLAAGHIAEAFYGHPSRRLRIMGVTGTNGKTTVAHLTHQLLNRGGLRCGLIGTVLVDDGRSASPADMTTPACGEASQALATMVETGCTHAAMEVSSHALDQKRTDAIRISVGVFTNLSGDHLDYHGTMDAYASAKRRLFGLLPADALAIINGKDDRAGEMLAACTCEAVRTGENFDAWVRRLPNVPGEADPVRLEGPFFEAAGVGGLEAPFALMGEFNLSNLAQACVAALRLGLDAASLASAIPLLEPPAGRLEPVAAEPAPTASAQDVRVFIDFAHTDAALERSLAAVRPAVPEGGRLVVVFGCGGDRDRSKRPRMGAAAHRLADRVIVTSDNPRSERPSDIVSDVLSGVPAPDRGAIDVQVERERAIEHAIETAEPGDVIVIAGKGHEREQIFADESGAIVRRPFDDRAIAAAALGRRAERLSRAATVESAAPAGTEAES